jgi:tRNA (guanine-N(7)-)-methyltransferase subunit TRM82
LRDGIVSHENPSRGTLVLGHASLVITFLLSLDEKFIITADRDEHIRVSWYPQGYNIEIYCLGHEKYVNPIAIPLLHNKLCFAFRFVSALHIPASSPSTLISAGGDPVIKFWDWMTGTLLQEIRVGEAVEPFIVVKGRLKRWMEEDELGNLATVNKKPKGKRKSGSRQKGKNVDVKMETRNADSTEGTPGLEGNDDGEEPRITADVEMLILAIHKVECLHSSRGRFVVFAAHGLAPLSSSAYLTNEE